MVLSVCRKGDFGREFDDSRLVEFEATFALLNVIFPAHVEEMVDFRVLLRLHAVQPSVEARPSPSASRVCAIESQVEEQAVKRLHEHKVFVVIAFRLLDYALVRPIVWMVLVGRDHIGGRDGVVSVEVRLLIAEERVVF